MYRSLRQLLLSAAWACLIAGCQGDAPPAYSEKDATPATPQTGDYLSYVVTDRDSTDADRVTDACSLTGEHSVVALARLTSPQSEYGTDCPDITWPAHQRRDVVVERTILGSTEEEVTVVYGMHNAFIVAPTGPADVGDRFLLELRERNGLYVVLTAIPVALEPDEKTAIQNTEGTVDLPAAISDLTAQVQAAQMLDSCPNSERNPIVEMAADDYEALVTNPDACDDPNPSPSGSCQTDSDCSPGMVCKDGRCRDECDPNETDAGCLLSDD